MKVREHIGSSLGRVSLALPLLVVAFGVGCATLFPLSPETAASRLAARAQSPEELGLRVEPGSNGFRLSPVREILKSGEDTLSFRGRTDPTCPLVWIRLNGHEVLALMDTGAGISLLDPRDAWRLGVTLIRGSGMRSPATQPPILRIPGRGLGQTVHPMIGLTRELRIGQSVFGQVPIGVLDLPVTGTGWIAGQPVGALIGTDILRLFGVLVFDFPNGALRIGRAEPDPPATAPHGLRIEMEQGTGAPIVWADIEGLGRCPVVPDTGGDFALWIPPEWSARMPVTTGSALPRILPGVSAGGSATSLSIGPRTLTLNGVPFQGVETVVGLNQPVGSPPIPYALLGRAFLKRFCVTFDFNRRLLILRPPAEEK